ncbi:tetratricopeptide repeat protein, partial [bacterium]|nr:tetratricopeptide repeat protein [bacterium]
ASILKSLKLKTNNPDALINLGSIYKKLGNLDQALASTLESLKLKPDNPDAFRNLSSIYKELGNHRQSFASALRSVELKADNPDILMNLCLVYGEEELEKIKKIALKIINESPNCLNNLKFIDAISSLGDDFTRNALAFNDMSSRSALD